MARKKKVEQKMTDLELLKIDFFEQKIKVIVERMRQDDIKAMVEEKNEEIARLNKKLSLFDKNNKNNEKSNVEREVKDFMNGIRKRLGLKEDEPFGYNPETGEII